MFPLSLRVAVSETLLQLIYLFLQVGHLFIFHIQQLSQHINFFFKFFPDVLVFTFKAVDLITDIIPEALEFGFSDHALNGRLQA